MAKAQFTKTELYASAPVSKAIISLAVPTVLSQLITVIYNMADTFFIGQLGDPAQVAAATLCMPAFILLSGLANLFGIGGSSLISRSLGAGNSQKARQAACFSIWSAGAIALLYGLLFLVFKPYILPVLGTTESTYEYCFDYLFWTITIGAVPTVLSACLAHLIRAEGLSKHAGFGIALGGMLNVVLDPIFIFLFDMGIVGAAIATALSNCIAFLYFVVIIAMQKGNCIITPSPKHFTLRDGIPKEILSVGLPNFIMNLSGILSNIVLNNLMASYSDAATAGIGIAKKIDMLTFAVSIGMSQGVISLIGYNYAARNIQRMLSIIKTTFRYLIIIAVATTLFLFFLAAPVSKLFINDAETVEYGQYFLRVLCLICPTQAVSMMCIAIMQAMGKKVQPLVLSFLRKGIVDTPIMLLLNLLVGVYGIAWATPIAELFAMIIGIVIFIPTLRQITNKLTSEVSN